MKFIICFIVIGYIGITIEAEDRCGGGDFEKLVNECQKVSHVSEDQLKKMCKEHKYPEEPEVKKQVVCVFKKLKVIDDKDNISEAGIKAILKRSIEDEELAKKYAKECAKTKKTAIGDKALEVARCMRSKQDNLKYNNE